LDIRLERDDEAGDFLAANLHAAPHALVRQLGQADGAVVLCLSIVAGSPRVTQAAAARNRHASAPDATQPASAPVAATIVAEARCCISATGMKG
jgi:hypothetical protein